MLSEIERKEAVILSMRQANKLTEWMNQRGINRCVACGTQDDWNFGGGEVFVPPETSEEGMSERFQPSVPRGLKVAFPCGTCGYVMLFDAATVGVTRFEGERSVRRSTPTPAGVGWGNSKAAVAACGHAEL